MFVYYEFVIMFAKKPKAVFATPSKGNNGITKLITSFDALIKNFLNPSFEKPFKNSEIELSPFGILFYILFKMKFKTVFALRSISARVMPFGSLIVSRSVVLFSYFDFNLLIFPGIRTST